MLSQRPRSRLSSSPPASRVADRARAAAASSRPRAYDRTTHGPARSPEMLGSRARRSGPSVRLATAGRGRNFSSLQTAENKGNRIGIPIFSRSEDVDATAATISPDQGVATPRPSSASFAGNQGVAKFSYPQASEKARNGEGISPAVARVQGQCSVRLQRFHP